MAGLIWSLISREITEIFGDNRPKEISSLINSGNRRGTHPNSGKILVRRNGLNLPGQLNYKLSECLLPSTTA